MFSWVVENIEKDFFQVNKYLENYEKVFSGFDVVVKIDFGLNVFDEIQKLVRLFDKLEILFKVSNVF